MLGRNSFIERGREVDRETGSSTVLGVGALARCLL